MFYIYYLFLSINLLWQPEIPQVIEAHKSANEYRLKHHRDSLILDSMLCAIAQKHSENMASGKVKFGHKGFSSRTDSISKYSDANAFAENVFYGSEEASGERAVKAWINSKEHRDNLKSKIYKRVGYGVAKDGEEGIYYTQIFSN